MDSEYLKKYYDFERNHWWFLVREKIIRQLLDRSLMGENLKILNAGAATGKTSQMLGEYGAVTTLEKDHDTCFFLTQTLGITAVEGDLEALPFEDNSFDVVCIFDVIEHVENEGKALEELFRVCKPGGQLFCSVPAFSFLWSNHDDVNDHKRRYTRKKIINVLEKKFKVDYSTYFNFFLFFPILIMRTLVNRFWKPNASHSDFEVNSLIDKGFVAQIFKQLFSLEIILLRHVKFPFGVSILVRAVKPLFTYNDKHL